MTVVRELLAAPVRLDQSCVGSKLCWIKAVLDQSCVGSLERLSAVEDSMFGVHLCSHYAG